MNIKRILVMVTVTASAAAFFAFGCGGGGSNSTSTGTTGSLTEAVEIASQVSLVEAQDVAAASLTAPLKGFKALLSKAAPTSGAYVDDPLNMWVDDSSMQALDLINEILCSFDQTGYADMVGQGPYLAIVSFTDCASDSTDKSSDVGNQSSSEIEELETWTVESSLADGVQTVKAWIPTSEQMGPGEEIKMVIHAKATITAGVSDENPFGLFRMDFAMLDEAETTPYANIYLESVETSDGQVELQFSMTGADGSPMANFAESVHVVMDADGTTGHASAAHQFEDEASGYSEDVAYNVAFDENKYLSSKGEGTDSCLDRKNFDSYIYRYGVYKADGSRLDSSNPGFSVKYDNGGELVWGFAGYYGIWLPEEVTLESGLTLTRADGSASSGLTYTTVVAPGKLMIHTKDSDVLGSFLDDTFYYWDNANFIVTWNGTNLVKTQEEMCDENGCQQTDIEDEAVALVAGSWVSFWKDGLGSIFFEVPAGGLSNSTVVGIDKSVIATAEDVGDDPIQLFCFNSCLQPNLTADQLSWIESPFFPDSFDLAAPYIYTLDPADMTLKGAADAEIAPVAGLTAAEVMGWGASSGPMVTSTAGMADTGAVWSADTYYSWETGIQSWNKFAGLIDESGNPVAFDPPTMFAYTHTDGEKYMLDYSGFGELNGVPWSRIEGTDLWVPLFSIPDGMEVTANNVTYYVRALEGSQRMQELDLSQCSELET
ncbi:MAG: hypothetical protein HYU98_05485, partial [Deltaproteobacteria bacterium]|nr:hypothetical protein [Deltaproteobacteria bacterium]